METGSVRVHDDKVGDERPQAADPTNRGSAGGAETPPTCHRKETRRAFASRDLGTPGALHNRLARLREKVHPCPPEGLPLRLWGATQVCSDARNWSSGPLGTLLGGRCTFSVGLPCFCICLCLAKATGGSPMGRAGQ